MYYSLALAYYALPWYRKTAERWSMPASRTHPVQEAFREVAPGTPASNNPYHANVDSPTTRTFILPLSEELPEIDPQVKARREGSITRPRTS